MQPVSATKATNTFFVICNECFWCASLLGERPVDACPSCCKALIEVMPLAANERYAFDCNAATDARVFAKHNTCGMTDYNKTSCRACGNALRVTRACSHFREPVDWKRISCPYVDDSVHVHTSNSQGVRMLTAGA